MVWLVQVQYEKIGKNSMVALSPLGKLATGLAHKLLLASQMNQVDLYKL